MALPQGIYFRSTDNQVDPSNYDAWVIDNGYPTTSAQGNSVGYESTATNKVDRDVTSDVRLKGIHYILKFTTATFRIDLPSSGSYNLRAALGDSGFSHGVRVRVNDTTTNLLDSQSAGEVPSNQWMDITGVIRTTESDWVNNNASSTKTFTTTICRFVFGNYTGTGSDGNTVWNACYVEAASSTSFNPMSGRLFQTLVVH